MTKMKDQVLRNKSRVVGPSETPSETKKQTATVVVEEKEEEDEQVNSNSAAAVATMSANRRSSVMWGSVLGGKATVSRSTLSELPSVTCTGGFLSFLKWSSVITPPSTKSPQ